MTPALGLKTAALGTKTQSSESLWSNIPGVNEEVTKGSHKKGARLKINGKRNHTSELLTTMTPCLGLETTVRCAESFALLSDAAQGLSRSCRKRRQIKKYCQKKLESVPATQVRSYHRAAVALEVVEHADDRVVSDIEEQLRTVLS